MHVLLETIRIYLWAIKKGLTVGFDWYYYVAFARKLPRWLCWAIGIILLPVNWICVLILVVIRKWPGSEKAATEIIAQIEESKL